MGVGCSPSFANDWQHDLGQVIHLATPVLSSIKWGCQ